MLITAYELAGVIIYPQSKYLDGRPEPVVSEKWFIMPGRRFVSLESLQITAKRLNKPLVKIKVPFQMPLDRERRQ